MIVDDFLTDKTVEIIKEFLLKDNRIKLFLSHLLFKKSCFY